MLVVIVGFAKSLRGLHIYNVMSQLILDQFQVQVRLLVEVLKLQERMKLAQSFLARSARLVLHCQRPLQKKKVDHRLLMVLTE